jgi:hypothetical protein
MLLMKACPRCEGDVSPIEDFEGDLQLSCLQCGYTAYGRRDRRIEWKEAKPVIVTLPRAS